MAQLSTDTVTAQQCSDLVASCRHPTVLVLDNIHAQGSKIMQILARSVEADYHRRIWVQLKCMAIFGGQFHYVNCLFLALLSNQW